MKVCRIKEPFEKRNKEWLEFSILFCQCTRYKHGRSENAFDASCGRSRRQEIKKILRKSTPTAVLILRKYRSIDCGEARVYEELRKISTSNVLVQHRLAVVVHNLISAMIHDKVCNALTQTTSMKRWNLFGATSKQVNNAEEMIQRERNTDNVQFGMSVLHG
ncbi:hypothetical protein PR048_024548 [Dryococelus australis]|uniref:Uncharacterized protein n=1 Tax=Dryococelus australis TaxID=614101 RepID=A0ABQ9GNX1_9NEOP|nr:hypothetical protein PR048_024548 [Dryococelus australis]